MAPKSLSPAVQAIHDHSRKCSPIKEVPATISTPLKHQFAIDMGISTVSTMESSLSKSIINSQVTVSLTTFNFKDFIASEYDLL